MEVRRSGVRDDRLLPGGRLTSDRACGGRTSRAGATLPGGVKLPGLAHHLIDLGDMLLLESDLFPGVFF